MESLVALDATLSSELLILRMVNEAFAQGWTLELLDHTLPMLHAAAACWRILRLAARGRRRCKKRAMMQCDVPRLAALAILALHAGAAAARFSCGCLCYAIYNIASAYSIAAMHIAYYRSQ